MRVSGDIVDEVRQKTRWAPPWIDALETLGSWQAPVMLDIAQQTQTIVTAS